MHLGWHWVGWGVGTVLFIFSVFLVVRCWRKGEFLWAKPAILALIASALAFFQGWLIWPEKTAERFIWLVAHSEFGKANGMLPESFCWEIGGDGSVTIRAEDGDHVMVAPNALPFVAGASARGVSVRNRSMGEIIGAQQDFSVGTSGKSTCIIHCTAERGSVRCRRIEQLP